MSKKEKNKEQKRNSDEEDDLERIKTSIAKVTGLALYIITKLVVQELRRVKTTNDDLQNLQKRQKRNVQSLERKFQILGQLLPNTADIDDSEPTPKGKGVKRKL